MCYLYRKSPLFCVGKVLPSILSGFLKRCLSPLDTAVQPSLVLFRTLLFLLRSNCDWTDALLNHLLPQSNQCPFVPYDVRSFFNYHWSRLVSVVLTVKSHSRTAEIGNRVELWKLLLQLCSSTESSC